MKKILIIGDNRDKLTTLEGIIRKTFDDAQTIPAADVLSGIEMALSETPDVILLDISKPQSDGFDVCRRLKQDEQTLDIPVVFVIGNETDKKNRAKAVSAGADGFLKKPVDEAELLLLISAMVKLKRLAADQKLIKKQSERLSTEQQNQQRRTSGQVVELESENESLREIERKLRESEELFRNIFEYHTAIKFIVDPENGNIIDANNSAARFYGWTKEQLKKMNIAEINTEAAERIEELMLMARNQEKDHFEFQHRLADGSVRDVEVFSSKIEVNGKYLLHSIVHDITHRKEVERAIIVNEARLKRAELASKSGNWELHLGSQIMEASEGARKIYGISDAHITYDQVKSIPLAEYRPMMDQALKRLFEGDGLYDIEFKIKAADTGEVKDIHSIAQFDRDRKIIFGVIQDITDRKKIDQALLESERRFKDLVEYMQVGVLLQGLEAEILLCNPKSLELLGLSEDQLLGKTSFDPDWNVIHEDGSVFPGIDHPVPKAIALRKPVRNVVMGVYRPSRRDRVWLLVDAEPQLNGDGTVHQVVCTFIDISERRKAEEALKESETRLRELNATKDKFFTIIAHDLKSPFNSILGFSNLLLDQVREKDYNGLERYAEIIENSAERVMDLLTNLLDWSQSQTGRMEFNPEYVEVVQLIEKTIKLSNDTASQKSIEIRKKLPGMAIAFADKSMISAILRNLLSNAVKFTEPGGQIVVEAKQLPNELLISVSDNGVGMGKKALDKLFRIEENLSTAGTKNEKGTGLGLILCKEFIDKHRGRIWAESEPGQGSSFYFTIPGG